MKRNVHFFILLSLSLLLFMQQGLSQITPTAGSTTTVSDIMGSTNFYDPGGQGGDCSGDGAPNNYPNCSCTTITTLCAPVGETLTVTFTVYGIFTNFDYLNIYDGPDTSSPQVYDAVADGGGTLAAMMAHSSGGIFVSSGNCLTFEFYSSGVTNHCGWEATVTSSAVPVELLYFDAKSQNNKNYLAWATASELNNAHFVVERSIDGKSFQALAKVEGVGTTVEEQQYSFIDETPAALSYYRLKQVDIDGSFEYSKIVSVRSFKEQDLVDLYPVPVKDYLTMRYKASGTSTVQFILVDALGRIIKQQALNAQSGINQHIIDLSEEAEGVYFVWYQDGQYQQQYKISKIAN